MRKFEARQYIPEGEKHNGLDIEIPKEEWETLELIARRVGGDFRMKIKLGKLGGGSFFNSEDCSITFDPIHIKNDFEQVKFVAAHEGAHRAISVSPKELGLSQEEVRKFYSQIGFGFIQNVIEDVAVNSWMEKRFPGLEPLVDKVYDQQFKKENAVLSTPEVSRLAQVLGYWPKFAQYGSEIIRDWHQKRFSKKLDPAVERALKRTLSFARESSHFIPDPQKPTERNELRKNAEERFDINTNDIWPEVKKLVEMDLRTEEQRQMNKEFRQKQKELKREKDDLEKAKRQGDSQKEKGLQKDIEKLEKELKPFNKLPEDAKKELEEQIDKAIRKAAGKLNKEIERKKKHIEETKKEQEKLGKEIQELKEKIEKAGGEERKKLEKQLNGKEIEKLTQKTEQKQAEDELKQIRDDLEQIKSGEEMPYPESELSEKTKREISKLFDSLPKQKQTELRKKSERQLENFEDAVNKELEGKLNKDTPLSHKESRKMEKEKEEREMETKLMKEKARELEKKLEKMRREGMTEYDKAYEETADIINALYNSLKKFFLPERHPKWKKGYSTGSRLDLGKVMQSEADPRYLGKLWERKTIPRKFDYRFSLLIDLSGSMEGEKIEETFKGLVVLAEVLEKLGIQYEIRGFSDGTKVFKKWQEKLTRQLRNTIGEIKQWGGGATETTKATQEAEKEFEKRLGKNNFLITFTDGMPDSPRNLKKLLEEIEGQGRIKLVGIGLGPGTEFVKEYYPAAFSLPKIQVTEEERRQGEKDFAEAFADTLEDMIRHPEKY